MSGAVEGFVRHQYDALVIGAGPAGASAAILLAQAGWQVSLVEQHIYPRQKVCGECIAAGNFSLLEELGIGQDVRQRAGPELKLVGWMHREVSVVADMPAARDDKDPYGRALGRDVLDALLLERARAAGVSIFQPAKAGKVRGRPGAFRCDVQHLGPERASRSSAAATICASIVIDAHGSWESGPAYEAAAKREPRPPQRSTDLFAFKATFSGSALPQGLLPVVAVAGGYGGLVVANQGRTTVALCLRRDALRALRYGNHGLPAGAAVESHLRQSCQGVRAALEDAQREGSWLTVGPLRPGIRLQEMPGVYRVGNAAGETHPLIGEGISMALQSSRLLVESLLIHADRATDAQALSGAHRAYASAWRAAFLPRLRLAALYAHVAMRTPFAVPLDGVLRHRPTLLTTAARFAGKAQRAVNPPTLSEEPI